jgi:lipopolysaccharide/colanic/teichoic acid biosynthesis glycosyltransferase
VYERVRSKMRIPLPASCGAFRLNFSVFDITWIFVSPVLALYLSNAYVVSSPAGAETVILYCAVSAASSAVAFLIFRFQDCLPRYFSVFDALEVSKAVVTAELMTCIALFSLTRLDGIPRSAPIIHAMILAAGLIAVRVAMRVLADDRNISSHKSVGSEHIMVIGANQFSSLYIKLLKTCDPFRRRVIGVLDGRSKMLGRLLEGVRIVGAPEYLDALINEYSIHGIKVDRIVIGGGPDLLPVEEMTQVRRICARRQIGLDFVPQLVGLTEIKQYSCATKKSNQNQKKSENMGDLILPAYFRFKPAIDFCAALTLLTILMPLLLSVAVIVLIDMGLPVLFWQQRLGIHGQNFLLYKFRTLRAPFNSRGEEIPPDQRLSWAGHLLRDTGLDELPQLLNVLVGDMSLIGPRPLLPEDQPVDSTVRLLVRPGITGWAQVSGGKLLTPEEKVKLDEWYIKNASLLVDINLVWRTMQIVRLGARRSNEAAVGPGKRQLVEHWQNGSASRYLAQTQRINFGHSEPRDGGMP